MRNVNYNVLTYKIIFKLLFKMCMSSLSNTGPYLQILLSYLCLSPFLFTSSGVTSSLHPLPPSKGYPGLHFGGH